MYKKLRAKLYTFLEKDPANSLGFLFLICLISVLMAGKVLVSKLSRNFMKRGVSTQNQETNDIKRFRADSNQLSTIEMISSKGLLGQTTQVTTNVCSLSLVSKIPGESREPRKRKPDNIEENSKQSGLFKCPKSQQINETNKIEQCSSHAAVQQTSISQLPQELFFSILKFSGYLRASRVSWLFYSTQEEIMCQEYNLNKEQFRPSFYTDKSGSNKAAIEQQQEINHFLDHEEHILLKTKNAKEVKSLFEELKEFKNIQSNEVIRFLAREKLLDELNAAIVEVRILESRSNKPETLDCQSCFLTRFPGKIITKHIDYCRALENLFLNENALKSLPPQIEQFVEVDFFDLGDNQFQSLPPQLEQLKSRKRLFFLR